MLWESVELYQKLTGELVPIFHVYRCWFMSQNLDFFTGLPGEVQLILESLEYAPEECARFYEEVLPIAIQGNA
jgi:hypothetical protein